MLIQEQLTLKENFSDIESAIADYFIKEKDNIAKQSARMIASNLYIAPSTISRFCRKLGFEGYNDFKENYLKEIIYLRENSSVIDPNHPFNTNDLYMELAGKMKQIYHEYVDEIYSLLDHDTLVQATALLEKASTILIISAGVQIDIARVFKERLLAIGKNVIVEDKIDEAFYRVSFCESQTVCLFISYSGTTEITLRVAKKAFERNIPSIALTSMFDNPLTHYTNYQLYLPTKEKLTENYGHFGVNLAVLYLLDVLYACIFNIHQEENYNHRKNTMQEYQTRRKSSLSLLQDKKDE